MVILKTSIKVAAPWLELQKGFVRSCCQSLLLWKTTTLEKWHWNFSSLVQGFGTGVPNKTFVYFSPPAIHISMFYCHNFGTWCTYLLKYMLLIL